MSGATSLVSIFTKTSKEGKGSASWQKSQKPLQIRTGVYRTVPPEPHEPLSNRYFQFFVIYLGFKITFINLQQKLITVHTVHIISYGELTQL